LRLVLGDGSWLRLFRDKIEFMDSNFGFVLISYVMFFTAISVLIIWTWLGRRSLKRRLEAVSDRIDESHGS